MKLGEEENFKKEAYPSDFNPLRLNIGAWAYLDITSIELSLENFSASKWTKVMYEKLQSFQTWLESEYKEKIDPVKYLAFMYYWKKISMQSIWEKHNNHWFNYTSFAAFTRAIRKALNWELRDETTRQSTLKATTQEPINGIEKMKKVAEENQKKLLMWFIKNSKQSTKKFDIKEFKTKGYKIEKVKYLFEVFRWIDLDSISELWLKWRPVTPFLQEKIDEITNENNLENIKLTKDIVDLYLSKLLKKD